MERIELKYDGWLDWSPEWLTEAEATALLEELRQGQSWEQLSIHANGKPVVQPRLMDWAGQPTYRYSGLTLAPRPMSDTLAELTRRVSAACGVEFNHLVLNLYRDGNDRVGPHADDEAELGPHPVIASISLGATRKFDYHLKNRRRSRKRFYKQLTHGSLLVMGGAFQHAYYHAVPARNAPTEPRINLTFRKVLEPPRPQAWEAQRASEPQGQPEPGS